MGRGALVTAWVGSARSTLGVSERDSVLVGGLRCGRERQELAEVQRVTLCHVDDAASTGTRSPAARCAPPPQTAQTWSAI